MFLVLEHYLNQPPHCLGFTQVGTIQPKQMRMSVQRRVSLIGFPTLTFISFAQVFITLVQFVCFVV